MKSRFTMKTYHLIPCLLLLATVPSLAQKAAAPAPGTAQFSNATLVFKGGVFNIKGLGSDAAVVYLTAGKTAGPVSLSLPGRELRARKIVANFKKTKGKKTFDLISATAEGEVYLHNNQKNAQGEARELTIRCERAEVKAGDQPGTGRIDFFGNAKVEYDSPLGPIKTTTAHGWIRLNRPEDPEPWEVNLDDGEMTGSLKEGKKK